MADQPNTPEPSETPSKPLSVQGSDKKKSDTTRIDLASAKPPPSIVDKKDLPENADEMFAMNTMRIEIPQAKVGDSDEVKKKTARIDIDEAATEQAKTATSDLFKKSTVPVGIPTPQPKPATVKPKTLIAVKKPMVKGESIVISPETTASATEQARKSETARIDLPADVGGERPATRPKTIRIKRPDGTSGKKALAIARPAEDAREEPAYTAPVIETGSDEEVGMLPAILAIAAVVIACVVVYMLAAQALGTDLPFPGRI
ncbi:MAG TPA: hypothetical protein PKE55_02000 [Kiritimatiellia bacterium]|nr:hypothetical protein [Kiritimatiellia bacterium]